MIVYVVGDEWYGWYVLAMIVFAVMVVIDCLVSGFIEVLGVRGSFIIEYLVCFVRGFLELNDLHQSFSFFFIHAIDEHFCQYSNFTFFHLRFPRLFLCFNHSPCLDVIIIHAIIRLTHVPDHYDGHCLKLA